MNNVHKRLNDLKTKVEKLVNLQEKLMKENRDLRDAYQSLQQKLSELEAGRRELEEKNKILKLSQAISSGGDQKTRELKLKINEYIREIDKCLAVINT
jgi:predicted nuclease with TOPRIM domain